MAACSNSTWSMEATYPHDFPALAETPAAPYVPYFSDPFPITARGVCCELLGFAVPLDPDLHRHLASHFILEKEWVKSVRALLSHGRTGQLGYHLAVARSMRLVPASGAVDATQLLQWARASNTPEYQLQVKGQKSHASMSQVAPAGFSPADAARLREGRGGEGVGYRPFIVTNI